MLFCSFTIAQTRYVRPEEIETVREERFISDIAPTDGNRFTEQGLTASRLISINEIYPDLLGNIDFKSSIISINPNYENNTISLDFDVNAYCINGGSADGNYLRLDTTNGPLTGQLEITRPAGQDSNALLLTNLGQSFSGFYAGFNTNDELQVKLKSNSGLLFEAMNEDGDTIMSINGGEDLQTTFHKIAEFNELIEMRVGVPIEVSGSIGDTIVAPRTDAINFNAVEELGFFINGASAGSFLSTGFDLNNNPIFGTTDNNAERFCVPDGNCWSSGQFLTESYLSGNYVTLGTEQTVTAAKSYDSLQTFSGGIRIPLSQYVLMGSTPDVYFGTDSGYEFAVFDAYGIKKMFFGAYDSEPVYFEDGIDSLGQATVSHIPNGTTSTTSSLVVNPASASANSALVWFGVNDSQKFRVDAEGDVFASDISADDISITGSFSTDNNCGVPFSTIHFERTQAATDSNWSIGNGTTTIGMPQCNDGTVVSWGGACEITGSELPLKLMISGTQFGYDLNLSVNSDLNMFSGENHAFNYGDRLGLQTGTESGTWSNCEGFINVVYG